MSLGTPFMCFGCCRRTGTSYSTPAILVAGTTDPGRRFPVPLAHFPVPAGALVQSFFAFQRVLHASAAYKILSEHVDSVYRYVYEI